MSRAARVAAAAGLVLAGACTAFHAQPLPAPVSRVKSATGVFRAGVARMDITPPPGVGLAGSGPEGRTSRGYRTRLYVNVLALEDASGERLVLAVADLIFVSSNLHRLVAERLHQRYGIGADRLILSATHTHSGPGHFSAERQYNVSATRQGGYDPRMVDFLVERIARAATLALEDLKPARAASGRVLIGGATRNRSFEAHCENPEESPSRECLTRPPDAVDSALFMLRVDRWDAATGVSTPLGSFSTFALHGTAIHSLNTLLDGDLQGRIVRRMEAHTDPGGPSGRVVHLLANGAEGDVMPAMDRQGCDLPRIGMAAPASAPRGTGGRVDFVEPSPGTVERCLGDALERIDRIVRLVSDSAIALYARVATSLSDQVPIRRAFTTVWLPGEDSLCGGAAVGSSTAAGADGLETRMRGWRWLVWPLIKVGIEEGGAAVQPGEGCHAPKRVLLGKLQTDLVVGEHGFPEFAQVTVVRIGEALLAALPGEVTTTAWRRMRAGLAENSADPALKQIALIGLANGYLQYVTTAEEYRWQAYEGGSVLYGPGMARFLQRRLIELAATLPKPAEGPSPAARVAPITAYPGPPSEILSFPKRLPELVPTGPISLRCRDDLLTAEWRDLSPGQVLASSTPWIVIEQQAGAAGWERVAAEGDGHLELYALGDHGTGGTDWRLLWRPGTGAGRYRVVRPGETVATARISAEVWCGRGKESP